MNKIAVFIITLCLVTSSCVVRPRSTVKQQPGIGQTPVVPESKPFKRSRFYYDTDRTHWLYIYFDENGRATRYVKLTAFRARECPLRMGYLGKLIPEIHLFNYSFYRVYQCPPMYGHQARIFKTTWPVSDPKRRGPMPGSRLVFDSLVDFDRVPDTPPGDVPGDMKWEVRP